MTDRDELEQLRARVTELETDLRHAQVPQPNPRSEGTRWRRAAAVVLLTLACVSAPLSVVSVWASTEVSDTEQYVETVAPLADDPDIQQAVAAHVTRVVLNHLDVEQFTAQALDALAQLDSLPPRVAGALPALAVPIADGIEGFTRTQVANVITGPKFATAWEQVNRAAHDQVVILLEGNQSGAVSAQGDTVTLNLGPILGQVKQRLADRGFTLADNIATVDRTFVLVQSEAVTDVQGLYRLLTMLGTWLPVITLVLFVAGVYLARDRRRALGRGALGAAGAMLVLGVGLAIARLYYLGAVPPDGLPAPAAGDVFDTLVRYLRYSLRAVAVLALVVAVGAYVTGPAPTAVAARSKLTRGIGRLRRSAETAGVRTGVVGTWTFAQRHTLRIGAVILGGLVLTFSTRPTVGVIVITALIVLFAIGLVELLARPPATAATPTAVAGNTTSSSMTGPNL